MKIKITEVKQSEEIFRFFFPEIPAGKNEAKSFKAFWREDKNPSASFFKSKSGDWILNDFAQSKGYDIFAALKEFKNLSFKNVCEVINSHFPQFNMLPEKNPAEWADRRGINKETLQIGGRQEIKFEYLDWQTNNKIGTKYRLFGNKDRFRCDVGLDLRKHFFHVNLGQAKRLYILGGEGDCIALSQKVDSPCVAISGESNRLPTDLIDCINFYKFEEVYIAYDNPLYEKDKRQKVDNLADELFKLESVNLVYEYNWENSYFKDIGEICGSINAISELAKFNRLLFKPIDEDKELLLEALHERNNQINLKLIDFLPNHLANYLESLAQSIDPFFPREAILTFFLSIVSGLVGINKTIEFNGSDKHSVLWSIVALPVGSGKSPILNHLIKPLQELEVEYFKGYMEEMKAYDELMQEIKMRRKNKEANLQMPKLPVHKHILLSNTTIEALRRAYLNNADGILVTCDEIASFFNSHNQYKGGSGDDRQSYLSFASGEGLNTTRVEETNNIRTLKTSVSLTGGTQPNILKDLYNADKLKADGLWDRFLYYYNPSYKMCEDFCNAQKPSMNYLRTLYNNFLRRRSLNQVYSFENSLIAEKVSKELKQKINASDEVFKGYYAKQWNQFLQLSLILQILNAADSPVIKNGIAAKAYQLINYYCFQAERMFSDFTNRKKEEVNIYSKILGLTDCSARAVIQRNWAKNKQDAIKIFKEMEKLDLGKMLTSPRGAVSFDKK